MSPIYQSSDPMLGVQEVAEILGIVPRTLARWIEKGHFPAPTKLGGAKNSRMNWRESTVNNWIAEKEGRA